MYCHNQLLNHPLISPVNAGSLGGLPPLYIVSAISSLHCMKAFLTANSSIAVLRWIGASPRRNYGEAHLSPDFRNHYERLTNCPYSISLTKPRTPSPTRRRRGFSKTTRRRRRSWRRITLRPRFSCKSLMADATLRLLSPLQVWPNT